MAESVGTVHLSISADLDTLEARLKQRLGVLGKEIGKQLGQDLGREATRGVEERMASLSQTAFRPLEEQAKRTGKKISDNLKITANTKDVEAKLAQLANQRRIVELTVEANTLKAEAKVAEFDAKENELRIDVDAKVDGAQAKLDALLAQRKTFEIEVEAQTLRARTQLDRLDEKRKVVIEADADTKNAQARIKELAAGASNAGNSFNLLGLIGVASMGTLLPVAAAATGAVVSLSSAAIGVGASFGVAALAFSGVGTALTALNNQESKAGETAAQAQTSALTLAGAYDSLKSARQGVADAEHQAALSTEQASQRTADAEKSLQQAQLDSIQTQKDLNAAREQAVRDLEDMSNRAADATLNERQANIDATTAQDEYNKALANPTSTKAQIEQAKLRRDQTVQQAKEARLESQRATDDNKKAQKAGVEGSGVVTQAKKGEKAATDKVHQAELDLTAARKNEAEVARQNAESIAKADQSVVAAQRSIQAALVATQQVGAATRNAVDEAFADLSPAGQHFAKFIYGLKGDLDGLKAAAQTALLPPLEKAIKILLPYLPQVETFVANVGRAMGDVAIEIARMFTSKDWREFFKILAQDTPGILRNLGDGFVAIGHVMARVFTAAAPFAKVLVGNIVDFFKTIDEKTSGKGGKSKLQAFFAGMMPVLGAVWNVVKSIGTVLATIVTGGSNSSGGAADTLNKVAAAIDRLATFLQKHPEVIANLGNIALGLIAIRAASPVVGVLGSVGQGIGGLAAAVGAFGEGGALAGVFPAIGSGIAAVAGAVGLAVAPFLLIVGAIVAVGVGLYLLYTKCQWFHDVVNTVVHAIGQFFVWLWQNAISPALHAIGAVFVWLYEHVISPYWQLIKLEIDIAWAGIQVTFGLIKIGIKIWSAIWNWLYDHVIHPIWNAISDHIGGVWRDKIQPVLNAISSFIHDKVAPKFQAAIKVLSDIWDGLMEVFKAPIRFLIQTVLDDGLLAAYNKLAKFFHVTPDDVHVDVPPLLQPAKHAMGGRILGPGTGTSDSIPALLSNGEHVWTAREVQAAGGHGAVEAVRSMVLNGGAPGFAGGGGVFGWVGSAASWVGNAAKNVAGKVADLVNDIASIVRDPAGALKNIADTALGAIPGGKDGPIQRVLVGLAHSTVDNLVSFAQGFLGGGGDGGGSVGSPATPTGTASGPNQAIGRQLAAARGWVGANWDALQALWMGESGWNERALNASSGAYGIPQSLPATKMAAAGSDWQTNPATQIRWGLGYIGNAYGSPSNAYSKWLARSPHWYDEGGVLPAGLSLVANGTGKPEAVFSSSQWAALEGNLGWGGDGGDYSKTTNIDVHAATDPYAVAAAIAAEQGRADLLDAISLY